MTEDIVLREDPPVGLSVAWNPKGYVANTTLVVNGEKMLADRFSVASHSQRQKFAKRVCERVPDLDETDLDGKLLDLAKAREADQVKTDEDEEEGRRSVTDLLIEIGRSDACVLAHDENGTPLARFIVDPGIDPEEANQAYEARMARIAEHESAYDAAKTKEEREAILATIYGQVEERELYVATARVGSKRFGLWLRERLWALHGKSAYSEAMKGAIQTLSAMAIHEGPQVPTGLRLAEHEGALYLDLGRENFMAVRITAEDWSVIYSWQCPVWFTHPGGMMPLPIPEPSLEGIGGLRRFLNVSDEDWLLVIGWLIGAMHPEGPYPILNVSGEQGTGKTTAQRMLRALVDPNKAPLRAEPREPRDLAVMAENSRVLGFDNLSYIRPWLSDGLCRMATGGGFAARELYTDGDEVIFAAKRPALLNGIADLATRSDLMDRCITLTLERIDHRQDEKAMWADFEEARPGILGGLLDAVSAGLAYQDQAGIEEGLKPRMLDFALWVIACEEGMYRRSGFRLADVWVSGWDRGAFLEAYLANREAGQEQVLEGNAVSMAVRAWMAGRDADEFWQGTAGELLRDLAEAVDEDTRKRRDWPGTPRKLTAELRRLAPNLRAAGFDVVKMQRSRDGQVYRVQRTPTCIGSAQDVHRDKLL